MKTINNNITNQLIQNDILNDLNRVANLPQTDNLPFYKYIKQGKFSIQYISQYFGSWDKASQSIPQFLSKKSETNLYENAQAISKKTAKNKRKKTDFYNNKTFFRINPEKNFGTWKPLLYKPNFDYSNFTRAEILADINTVLKKLNLHWTSYHRYLENGRYTREDISKYFITWTKTKEKANLKSPFKTDEEIINDMIAVANKLASTSLRAKDYNKYGIINAGSISNRFGSWDKALLKADLKNGRKPQPTELINDLKKVATQLNQNIMPLNLYRKHGKYNVKLFSTYFGTWNKAVLFAGLLPIIPFTEEDLINDLLKVKKSIAPKKLTSKEYKQQGKYSPSTMRYRFGSWNKALQKANIKISHTSAPIKSDQDLINDLKKVASKAGNNKITSTYYAKHGKYSSSPFYKRFGKWRNALLKAGLSIRNSKS